MLVERCAGVRDGRAIGASSAAGPTRVAVADADPVLRAAARLVLAQQGGFSVVEAADDDELQPAVAPRPPLVAPVAVERPPGGGDARRRRYPDRPLGLRARP